MTCSSSTRWRSRTASPPASHPKVDEYEGYLYIITHGLSAGATADSAEPVELDAFLGPNYLVTHHAGASRSVAAVMDQVTRSGIPLQQGTAAVLHAILDRQIDGLESVLDNIEARIETLEDAVFARPRNALIASLLSVKRNILELRRWTAKQREVLLRLGRREFALISAEDALLFRDVHDHLVRINDLLEGIPRHVDVDPGGVPVRESRTGPTTSCGS